MMPGVALATPDQGVSRKAAGLLLVQSFIRTSVFFGADADAFDSVGDAEMAGRGRGSGSGTDDAVRRCWCVPA